MSTLFTLTDEDHGPREVAIDVRGPMVTRGFGRPGALTWRPPRTYSSADHAMNAVAKDVHRFRMRGYTLGHRNRAFEDAILAEPGDVGRYLVYADWLIEQQDPRGRLIRLQVEHDDKPSPALARESDAMLERERIHFMPRAAASLHWRYGFIESFSMSTYCYRIDERMKTWLENQLLHKMRTIVRHPSGFALQSARLTAAMHRNPEAFSCTRTRDDL